MPDAIELKHKSRSFRLGYWDVKWGFGPHHAPVEPVERDEYMRGRKAAETEQHDR